MSFVVSLFARGEKVFLMELIKRIEIDKSRKDFVFHKCTDKTIKELSFFADKIRILGKDNKVVFAAENKRPF